MVTHANFCMGEQGRFCCIFRRHYAAALFAVAGNDAWQYAIDLANSARQSEFAHKHPILQYGFINLPRCRQNSHCYGQIKTTAGFGQIGRRKIDGDTALRKFKLRIKNGTTYSFFTFFDRGFWQTHNGETRQTIGQMHFYRHQWRIDADVGA